MISHRSCVGKDGYFIVGVHTPSFEVKNFRENDYPDLLGRLEDGTEVKNDVNFPQEDLFEPQADTIYEIPNAFAFRGTAYINSAWADAKARHPETIKIPAPSPCSFLKNIENSFSGDGLPKQKKELLDLLPHPLLLALAQASTDPEELVLLAQKSCRILFEDDGTTPFGIGYTKKEKGNIVPDIFDHELFEVLVNNPCLPDTYKNTLVLKPGVQGNNEITGEYCSKDEKTHVFEYLRRNSYIPWGHFASNMANNAIRYRAENLSFEDMKGIRHLYYQRAFARLAAQLDIPLSSHRKCLMRESLERLRQEILLKIKDPDNLDLKFNNTLWGWNFGFGYAQSGHRLHASHQMIHQQNAMVPRQIDTQCGKTMDSYACGDLVSNFIDQYREKTGKSFFKNYLSAIKNNIRTDGKNKGPASLIVLEDEHTILFVPKSQVAEWELQLMPKAPCGNIIEADEATRDSLDRGILTAVKTLEALGAHMVTSIEFSKSFDSGCADQHLLYSFIPRLPYAPGTFSEAQLRWISGCYPEDVAAACRKVITPHI